MPDDKDDGLADSPKDVVTGTVKRPPRSTPPSEPDKEATPAGRRNSAHRDRGDASEGADLSTEEAAAYRENDA